jgi:hypothetical protein
MEMEALKVTRDLDSKFESPLTAAAAYAKTSNQATMRPFILPSDAADLFSAPA